MRTVYVVTLAAPEPPAIFEREQDANAYAEARWLYPTSESVIQCPVIDPDLAASMTAELEEDAAS